jgi:5-methylcytosine-specific restriction endonuclease McrA
MTTKVITRKDAKEAGLTKYFTGKPCLRGHIAERYVGCGKCTDCQAIYLDKYRKNNREKYLSRLRDYHQRNRERVLSRQRDYYEKNSEQLREKTRNYFKENPEVKRKHERKRRAQKAGTDGLGLDFCEEKALRMQRGRCASCQDKVGGANKKYHVDHIVPLSRGGSNESTNLQILCVECNLRKSAKDPIEWANENGRLL